MFTKHFVKTLIMFTGIIALGLLGAFLVSHFDNEGNNSQAEVNLE